MSMRSREGTRVAGRFRLRGVAERDLDVSDAQRV